MLKTRALEGSSGCLWGVLWCLRHSWRILDASGVCSGGVLEHQGVSGMRLGGVLELSWDVLGGVLEDLGESWGLPGSFLVVF